MPDKISLQLKTGAVGRGCDIRRETVPQSRRCVGERAIAVRILCLLHSQ